MFGQYQKNYHRAHIDRDLPMIACEKDGFRFDKTYLPITKDFNAIADAFISLWATKNTRSISYTPPKT